MRTWWYDTALLICMHIMNNRFAFFTIATVVACTLVLGAILYISQQVPDACTVARIPVHGTIVYEATSSPSDEHVSQENVSQNVYADVTTVAGIRAAVKSALDAHAEALLLDVNSPGGSLVAAEAMIAILQSANVPIVAFVSEQGLSAAVYVASSAEYVGVNQFSMFGSIGITLSYLSEVEKNKKEGLEYVQVVSAPYKDVLSPYVVQTPTGLATVRRVMQGNHMALVTRIASLRHADTSAVAHLADGNIVSLDDALAAHLIDVVGTEDDVLAHLTKVLGHTACVMQ